MSNTALATDTVKANDRIRKHKFFTVADLKATPGIYGTEDTDIDMKVATIKFFNPYGAGTWYVVELDPETGEAFGYVDLGMGPGCSEFGYFNALELAEMRVGPFNLPLERDCYFGGQIASQQGLGATLDL